MKGRTGFWSRLFSINKPERVRGNEKVKTFLQYAEKAFNAEDGRRDILEKKAEKVFAAIALVASLRLLDITTLSFSSADQKTISTLITLLAFIVLGISLIFAIRSILLQPYRSFPKGLQIRDTVEAAVTDDDAKVKIGIFFLVAHDENVTINDKRARLIRKSIWSLTAGFLISVVGHILSKIRW